MEYDEFLRERRRRMADIVRVAFRQLGGEPNAAPLTPPWFLPGAEDLWKRIAETERALRGIIRDIYATRFGEAAARKILDALPENDRERLTRNLSARTAGSEPLGIVDYLYLGQIPSLLFTADVQQETRRRLGNPPDLKQRLLAAVDQIAPVRNEIAHVREVDRDRLLRASVACADILQMLGGAAEPRTTPLPGPLEYPLIASGRTTGDSRAGQTTGNSRDFFQSLIPSVSGRQRLTNLTPHGIMLIVRGSKLQPAFRSLARPAVKQYPRKTQQHRSSISAAQSAGCGLYLQPAKKEVRAILAARRDYYMSVQRDNLAKQSRTFSDNYRGWGCPPISLNAPHRIARASARKPSPSPLFSIHCKIVRISLKTSTFKSLYFQAVAHSLSLFSCKSFICNHVSKTTGGYRVCVKTRRPRDLDCEFSHEISDLCFCF